MLITMRKIADNRVREDHAAYRTKKGNLFDHEDLDVYQIALLTDPLSRSGGLSM